MKCLKNWDRMRKMRRQSFEIFHNDKNKPVKLVAKALVAHTDEILKANALDVENGKMNQMPEGMIDRLMLTPERIEGMADGTSSAYRS